MDDAFLKAQFESDLKMIRYVVDNSTSEELDLFIFRNLLEKVYFISRKHRHRRPFTIRPNDVRLEGAGESGAPPR